MVAHLGRRRTDRGILIMEWHRGKPSPNRATRAQDDALADAARQIGPMTLQAAAYALGCGRERLERVIQEYGITNIIKTIRNKRPPKPTRPALSAAERGKLVYVDGQSMKRCSVCHRMLKASRFWADPGTACGLRSACGMCESARQKENRRKSDATARE